MIRFKNFLNEALIDVDREDVNKIYEPIRKQMKELSGVWDKHIDRYLKSSAGSSGPNFESNRSVIARTISRELDEVIKKNQPVFGNPITVIRSSQLKSENAKKAHEVNPIDIYVWLVSHPKLGNLYNPITKVIHIGLDYNVYQAMMSIDIIPFHQIANLRNEVSDVKIKTTIRHELTHWMDDSLHNFYIRNAMVKMSTQMKDGLPTPLSQKTYKNAVAHGEDDVYNSPLEVTAMVNQIAEYKRRVGKKKYDSITWKDLMVALPSLSSLNRKWGAYWRRKMFTRLSREDLIGKNFMTELE